MASPKMFEAENGRRIAYHFTEGQGPGIVFLGGFMSDMTGTKAVHLEAWAKAQGRAFLRFDYSGHGQSSGTFTDGTISAWAEDAAAVINAVTSGPQILIGSSMGGWISCLLIRDARVNAVGLLTIAGAPDFTEDGFLADFDADQRATLERDGVVHIASDYGEPYPITKALIEDGRNNLILRDPLPINMPVRLVHGDQDTVVTIDRQLKLIEHIDGPNVRLVLLKGADHSVSTPQGLKLIEDTANNILQHI